MIGWADDAIRDLNQGKVVQIRPTGGSMRGLIESGQLCTIEPVPDYYEFDVGDIVLVMVRGRTYLHQIVEVHDKDDKTKDEKYLIGNNRGGTNGWVSRWAIRGICTKVEDCPLSEEEIKGALKEGAKERAAAEKTLKTRGRR